MLRILLILIIIIQPIQNIYAQQKYSTSDANTAIAKVFESLLSVGVSYFNLSVSGQILTGAAHIATNLFNKYTQYNDFTQESKDKIAKIEQEQKAFKNMLSDHQKQIQQQILEETTKIKEYINELETKNNERFDRLEQDFQQMKTEIKEIKEEIKEIKDQPLRKFQDDLANSQENLKEYFITYREITADNAQEARNELLKIRDQFNILRHSHLYKNRKDLQALTLIALSTIHKLLGNEKLSFKYLVSILQIPTFPKIRQEVMQNLDQNIQLRQDEIRFISNAKELSQKTKERDLVTQKYNDYQQNEDLFKLEDQYLIDLQNELRSTIMKKYPASSLEHKEILLAEKEALLNTQKSAEEKTKEIIQDLISHIK